MNSAMSPLDYKPLKDRDSLASGKAPDQMCLLNECFRCIL